MVPKKTDYRISLGEKISYWVESFLLVALGIASIYEAIHIFINKSYGSSTLLYSIIFVIFAVFCGFVTKTLLKYYFWLKGKWEEQEEEERKEKELGSNAE